MWLLNFCSYDSLFYYLITMVYCEIEEIKEAMKSIRIEKNVHESVILEQMKPIIQQHIYILRYAEIKTILDQLLM